MKATIELIGYKRDALDAYRILRDAMLEVKPFSSEWRILFNAATYILSNRMGGVS